MTDPTDYSWLASDAAIPFLNECRDSLQKGTSILRTAKTLRRSITPTQSAMVMELTNLRFHGQNKFSRADQMFFTQRSLEQATGETLALYKASRFSDCNTLADICCGIGGDAIALSRNSIVTGVDRDELVSLFARKNLEIYQHGKSRIETVEFSDFDMTRFDGIHLDPDRRGHGRKTLGKFFQPSLPDVIARIPKNTKTAIKVAPATPVHASVPPDAELEWIGEGRECKQQIIWLNGTQRVPASRVATLVKSERPTSFTATASEIETPQEIAARLGSFIYEPHSVLLAAGLTDAFAQRHDLQRLFHDVVYLTSNHLVDSPLVSRFEIVEIVAMNALQTAAALQKLNAGTVEYKKRVIGNAYYEPFTRIKTNGSVPFTVLLSPTLSGTVAIIARRIPFQSQKAP